MRTKKLIISCLAGALVGLTGVSIAQGDVIADSFSAMTGPVMGGVRYSNLYGAFLQAQLTQGLTSKQAASLEGEYGLDNHRINLGWGYAVTPQQRFKLAAEHLAQFMEFDFTSGYASRWVTQNGVGAAYQYLIFGSFVNDVNANVEYSQSVSENLTARNAKGSSILRHIAGADHTGVSVGADMTPTYGTQVGFQLYYDDVSHNIRYEGNDDDNGLGASITWQQLLTRHFKFNLLASHRVPYQDYQAAIAWLCNKHVSDQIQLALDIERIIGKSRFKYDDTRIGLNLIYAWNASTERVQNGFSLISKDSASDLADWVSQPALYLKQVLARSDQT